MTDLCGGGAEKALIEILKVLDYHKYKVSLCLLYRRGVYLSQIPKHVQVLFLFNSEKDFYHRIAFRKIKKYNNSMYLSFFLRMKLRKRYDIAISFLEGSATLSHSLIMDKAKMNLSWIHCDMFNYHYSHECFHEYSQEEECYKRMDKIVFVSQNAKNNFDKLYAIDTPKYCLHNILDANSIRIFADEKVESTERFTITSIGSLFEVKAFDRLIRVAKRLKDEGYLLTIQILGKGNKEEELLALRTSLDLKKEVRFLGFQSNPYPYLKQSNLFVSTSISEGLPYVICEALALGVPIVATKTAGAMELLENGEYGVLTDHDDDSIYQGIKAMLDNNETRLKYATKGLKRAEDFLPQKVMKEFECLIND